uniref:extensin-like domain-containing protein n=1 Tax=Stappia sp. TaxID=1870903 RepID=UPI003BAB16E6
MPGHRPVAVNRSRAGLVRLGLVVAMIAVPQALNAQVPRDKPGEGVGAPEQGQADVSGAGRKDLPRQKPETPQRSEPAPEVSRSDALSACLAALSDLGARVRPLEAREAPGDCGMTEPVALSAVGGMRISPEAELSCRTALAFATFAATKLFPMAEETLSSPVAAVRVAGAYECRGRNRQSGAQLSEHAFGRAIDVRGLVLENGARWDVRPLEAGDDDAGARFQRALRAAACGPFTTVLGPGADAYHDDHLHFDTKPRRSPYCR